MAIRVTRDAARGPRKAAFVFIFITLLLDMLALGMVIPVLPKLIEKFLAGDTARSATTSEVKDLRRQAQELKEVVAEQALELRLLKKSMIADGGSDT